MSMIASAPSTLDDSFGRYQAELAGRILRMTDQDGIQSTPIAGLDLFRSSGPTLPMPTLYRPCLCIMAQGSKEVRLGEERYVYDPLNYLVASVT